MRLTRIIKLSRGDNYAPYPSYPSTPVRRFSEDDGSDYYLRIRSDGNGIAVIS